MLDTVAVLTVCAAALLTPLEARAQGPWSMMEDQPRVTRIAEADDDSVTRLLERVSFQEAAVCRAYGDDAAPLWELWEALTGETDHSVGDSIVAVRFPLGGSPIPPCLLKVVYSGTGHYVQVLLVQELDAGFEVREWWGSEKATGPWHVLQDLDRDGIPEILAKNFLGEYSGASTLVDWTGIWRWDGRNWVRADAHFPRFYEHHVLPALRGVAKDLRRNWIGGPTDEENMRKLDFVMARIRDILAGQVVTTKH
ncbi:MAG: hypothetical protein FJ109_07740 [Deltaproteobacteria bacterium]|nr:hypothetical protein [Deltaproteobacteria bacterium]